VASPLFDMVILRCLPALLEFPGLIFWSLMSGVINHHIAGWTGKLMHRLALAILAAQKVGVFLSVGIFHLSAPTYQWFLDSYRGGLFVFIQ